MTNREFAAEDVLFSECCLAAKIPASGRQAGKYRRKVGIAYASQHAVLTEHARIKERESATKENA